MCQEGKSGELEAVVGERFADVVCGGKFVGVPEEVSDLEIEFDDTIFAGVLGGVFDDRAAASGLGNDRSTAVAHVGGELQLAEAKSERDVLHCHNGEKNEGKAGACKFAEHLVRRVGEGWEKSISGVGGAILPMATRVGGFDQDLYSRFRR